MPAIVRALDHVVITTPDPGALFSLFSETLGLPVVWPLLDFGGYHSGGVCAGNANIEIARAAPGSATAASGLVFAPGHLEESLAELDRRGLPHSPPDPYAGDTLRGTPAFEPATPPGTRLWTVVWLGELPGPGYAALCEYNYEALKPIPIFADELRARGGGPLGIRGLYQVVVGVADLTAAIDRWQLLMEPAARPAAHRWLPKAGPALALEPAAQNGILRLVFAVGALAQAEAALRSAGLLGEVNAKSLSLAPERVQGLDMRLV